MSNTKNWKYEPETRVIYNSTTGEKYEHTTHWIKDGSKHILLMHDHPTSAAAKNAELLMEALTSKELK